jgi:hypothetical protein
MWEYIEYLLADQAVFGRVVVLGPWPDRLIGELIDRRMRSTGHEARFEGLLTAPLGPAAAELELDRVRERFNRLLWDYVDGVPRVAMHYWLWSLSARDPGTVDVKLFEAPDPDELERLEDQSRFVLHAVVIHENLLVDDAVAVLRYPRAQVVSLLEMLRARGYLKRYGDRYRVTMRWSPAVVRYLRRKHLLFT